MDVDFIYRLSNISQPILIEKELANYRMQKNAKSIDQAESSKSELLDWINYTILMDSNIGYKARLYLMRKLNYLDNKILHLENEKKIEIAKLKYLNNHIVIGKVITLWKRYINHNLSI